MRYRNCWRDSVRTRLLGGQSLHASRKTSMTSSALYITEITSFSLDITLKSIQHAFLVKILLKHSHRVAIECTLLIKRKKREGKLIVRE